MCMFLLQTASDEPSGLKICQPVRLKREEKKHNNDGVAVYFMFVLSDACRSNLDEVRQISRTQWLIKSM
jgi:hypothetical protein